MGKKKSWKKSLNLSICFFFWRMRVEVGLVNYNTLPDLLQSEYFMILSLEVSVNMCPMYIYALHVCTYSQFFSMYSLYPLLSLDPHYHCNFLFLTTIVNFCITMVLNLCPLRAVCVFSQAFTLHPELLFLNTHKIPHPFILRSPSVLWSTPVKITPTTLCC